MSFHQLLLHGKIGEQSLRDFFFHLSGGFPNMKFTPFQQSFLALPQCSGVGSLAPGPSSNTHQLQPRSEVFEFVRKAATVLEIWVTLVWQHIVIFKIGFTAVTVLCTWGFKFVPLSNLSPFSIFIHLEHWAMVYWEITAQSCSSALHSSLKFPTHQVDGDSTKTVTLSGSVPNSSDGLIFVKGWVKDRRSQKYGQ